MWIIVNEMWCQTQTTRTNGSLWGRVPSPTDVMLQINIHLQTDNILKVDLELPDRTTSDFVAPSMSSDMQAILDATMEDEDVVIDAS